MKIRYLAYLLLLSLCCCKKKSVPIPPDPSFSFVYTPVYDSVITMQANDSYSFIFDINVTNGNINDNKLWCTISGLPGDVTVIPGNMTVGLIMGGVFTFKTADISLGTDTLTFSIFSKATGTAVHKLILHIVPPPDYAPLLAGTYDSSYDFCSPAIYKYTSLVSTAIDTGYTIDITNINALGSGFVVKAVISDVVKVPYQVVGSRKIWGSGTYGLDPMTGNTQYELSINDTIVSGLDTTRCTTHIQHK